jgi:preprotein translocase subunit YajC
MKNDIMDSLRALLALGPQPTQPGTQQDPRAQMLSMVGMMVLMGVMFYFLLIRPQRVRAKQQEALLKTIKAGDKILTGSGIVGLVMSVKEKTLIIRSGDTKLELLKSAVTEITERAGGTGES